MDPKSIYEYDNYRSFLKDRYQFAKAQNPKYSFRFLTRQAGLSSSSFLKHVMDGKRNLSPESIEKIAQALKLTREETTYFRKLVMANQSKTIEEKQRYAKEILRSKMYRQTHPLKESEYLYFSKWYFVAIRELLTLAGAKGDPQWISERVLPQVPAVEVKQALDVFEKLGIFEKAGDGRYVTKQAHIATPDEVFSSSLAKVHCDFMELAKQSIDRFSREKRDISSVTIRVNSESIKKIKEKIQTFRKELVELCLSQSDQDSVYQLNLQLFPLAALSPKKEES